MDPKETRCEVVKWINLAQKKFHEPSGSIKENFWISRETISFSRRILFHSVNIQQYRHSCRANLWGGSKSRTAERTFRSFVRK